MKHTISLAVMLAVLWWLLSGFAKPLLLSFGVISVAFTLWLSHRMDVIDRESHPIHMSAALVRFWFKLTVEIIKSNVQVVVAVLSPRKDAIQPHFLQIQLHQTSALGKVILANSLTLTPGTVSVDLDGDQLLVHALTRAAGQGVRDGHLDTLVPADVEEVRQ